MPFSLSASRPALRLRERFTVPEQNSRALDESENLAPGSHCADLALDAW